MCSKNSYRYKSVESRFGRILHRALLKKQVLTGRKLQIESWWYNYNTLGENYFFATDLKYFRNSIPFWSREPPLFSFPVAWRRRSVQSDAFQTHFCSLILCYNISFSKLKRLRNWTKMSSQFRTETLTRISSQCRSYGFNPSKNQLSRMSTYVTQ